MKKRFLPIPLILLIPIVLFVIVVIAGIYRFSLSDEEILAKYPSSTVSFDPVVLSVFELKSINPWTIEVPESHAFSFINQINEEEAIAFGQYDSGAERGTVRVDIGKMISTDKDGNSVYLAPMSVSNQGSGVFYYLALFKFDKPRSRVVLANSVFVGDRININALSITEKGNIELSYLDRSQSSSMAEPAAIDHRATFEISSKLTIDELASH